MLSKTSVHALRAIAFLAALPPQSYAGAASIAKRIHAPANYLGKLLQTLCRHGVLFSQKGLGGGFQLAKDPRKISLLEVVEPIDHISQKPGCALGQDPCSDKNPCAVHERWKQVRQQFIHFLEETHVSDLTKKFHFPTKDP